MPTYRAVTTGLISSFDAACLPEYAPGSGTRTPSTSSPGSPGSTAEPQKVVDTKTHIVSVYVPVYSLSLFWISYSISDEPSSSRTCYYFKMFVNQEHVVSWGVGRKEKFTGKTMFALGYSHEGGTPGNGIERKMFQLSGSSDEGVQASDSTMLQILVYRSKGRKRTQEGASSMQRMLADASKLAKDGESSNQTVGINFPGGGAFRAQQPLKFYRYALIDPLDDPYVTFRFYFRSWDQIRALGVLPVAQLLKRSVSSPAASTQKSPASGHDATPTKSIRSATPATPSTEQSKSSSRRSKTPTSSSRGLNTAHPLETPVVLPESTPGLTATAHEVVNSISGMAVRLPASMVREPSPSFTGTHTASPISWFRFRPSRSPSPATSHPRSRVVSPLSSEVQTGTASVGRGTRLLQKLIGSRGDKDKDKDKDKDQDQGQGQGQGQGEPSTPKKSGNDEELGGWI